MAKCDKTFFIVIYHSSLVKAAVNAARVCKLRNGVKKRLNFFFFQWSKVDQVRNEYSSQLSKLLYNCKLKNKEPHKHFKRLVEDGGRADFSKKPPRHFL
jgi:hypothetical protein